MNKEKHDNCQGCIQYGEGKDFWGCKFADCKLGAKGEMDCIGNNRKSYQTDKSKKEQIK